MVFWVITPYSSETALRFEGTYRVIPQGRRVSQEKGPQKVGNKLDGFFLLLDVLSLSTYTSQLSPLLHILPSSGIAVIFLFSPVGSVFCLTLRP
jgi:hypothetical protein